MFTYIGDDLQVVHALSLGELRARSQVDVDLKGTPTAGEEPSARRHSSPFANCTLSRYSSVAAATKR